MTLRYTTNLDGLERLDLVGEPAPQGQTATPGSWEGRVFGALVLAAFLLYGIGSAQAEHPFGLVLVAVNSVAVTVVGLIGFRLLRSRHRRIGAGYLGARIGEGVLLAGGIGLVAFTDSADADTTGYLLAMVALGVGSMPFCHALGQGRWLPQWLARWGIVGYAALATGALLELATGRGLTVLLAVPGGLFEFTLGLYLLRQGFHQRSLSTART